MTYFATCSFDLTHGATRDDYANAYADLATIGLYHVLKTDSGSNITLPSTTCGGSFTGQGAGAIRDDLMAKVQAAFNRRRFKYELFMSVGGEGWGWSHREV